MANKKVILTRYCKTPNGWRRYPAVIGKNGRVKPGYALVAGREVHYPDGHYELRSYRGKKMQYVNVGENAADALIAKNKAIKMLVARESAAVAGAHIVEEPGRIHLAKQLSRFIRAVEDREKRVAAAAYKLAAEEFLEVTGRTYADEVTPEDIVHYHKALRARKSSKRTVFNRHRHLMAFLRPLGLDIKTLAPSGAPKYDKTMPEVYSAAQLKAFFDSLSDPYHVVVFEMALKTGLREQELMHAEWVDLNTREKTYTVRSKPQYDFQIKDKEEREISVRTDLLALLKSYRSEHPHTKLILGTSNDTPPTHLLRLLKRLVKRAGLNCGRCKSCKERDECEVFFLHKFRSTYCTNLLRAGLDLSTVQHLMGHSDLASTLRYLRPAESSATQSVINRIKWH